MDEKNELMKRGINLPMVQSQNSKLVELEVKHHINVEDDERSFSHQNYWTSCCLKMDKRAVLFFSQLIFSLSICSFSIGMMVYNQDCPTYSRFSPLLTMIIGVWMPSPIFKDKN